MGKINIEVYQFFFTTAPKLVKVWQKAKLFERLVKIELTINRERYVHAILCIILFVRMHRCSFIPSFSAENENAYDTEMARRREKVTIPAMFCP